MTYGVESSRPVELTDKNELGLRKDDFLLVRRTVKHDIRKYGNMSFGSMIIHGVVSLTPSEIEVAKANIVSQIREIDAVVDSHHLLFASLEAFILHAGLEPLVYLAHKQEINPISGTVAARMGAVAGILDLSNTISDFEIYPDCSLGEYVLARPKDPNGSGLAYLEKCHDGSKADPINVVTGFRINHDQHDVGKRVIPTFSQEFLSPERRIKFLKAKEAQ